MDIRRNILPLFLALVLSLALHSTLLGVHPLRWIEAPPEPIDTVSVEFLGIPEALAPQAVPPPPSPTVSTGAGEEPPFGPPHNVEPGSPPRRRPPPPAQPGKTTAVIVPPETRQPPDRAAQLPDPAAVGVREATLDLGATDLRYRGYLDSVHDAIDRSQEWKEAVLTAGGGMVTVRMSLTSLGQVRAVTVTRSSGRTALDRAALQAVRNAPIPPFPRHWKIEVLHLDAQFSYEIITY